MDYEYKDTGTRIEGGGANKPGQLKIWEKKLEKKCHRVSIELGIQITP